MMILKVLVLLLSVLSLAWAEKLSTGQDVNTFVDGLIAGSDVMVFAKSYCPYCKRAVRMLTELKAEMGDTWSLGIVQLNDLPEEDGSVTQMELLTKTGQKTVPNIFIHRKHVGGNSQLVELHESGDLRTMLSKE
jgi:glutaredoxin 3